MRDERQEQRICYLSVYATHRAYGGPEEGGWYYTNYELVAAVPMRATALIRITPMEDDEWYAGGFDPEMVMEDEDGHRALRRASVLSFDNQLAVENERNRLTGMYIDSRGRLHDYTIVEEVYMGELARLTRPRYC